MFVFAPAFLIPLLSTERGLSLAALGAIFATDYVGLGIFFLLGGMAAASANAASGRVVVGLLSDRVGSRVRPLRWAAVLAGLSLLLLAGLDAAHWSAAAIVFVLATTFTVADNGLAFTAVAEMAGPRWAGRALGLQNTGQFLATSATAPLVGLLIGVVGYPLAFAAVALFPAVAIPLVPREDAEHEHFSA